MQNIINTKISANLSYLNGLLSSPLHKFDNTLRSALPELPGIYCIKNQSGMILRAGSTPTSKSLKQRVYQNHFMGNQNGNIRSQLVKDGTCKDLDDAKTYLKVNCSVQWKEILNNDDDRKWAEHFMLSILQPEFSD